MRVLLVLALAAAQPQQQFDLDCSGPVAGVDPATWTQASVHFRIDLAAGRWCEADCRAIHAIAEVQPTVVWFEKSGDAGAARNLIHFRAVDRESGEYTYVRESRSVATVAEKARCTRRPFTGFPTFATKF